jgi:hypothetical protein
VEAAGALSLARVIRLFPTSPSRKFYPTEEIFDQSHSEKIPVEEIKIMMG